MTDEQFEQLIAVLRDDRATIVSSTISIVAVIVAGALSFGAALWLSRIDARARAADSAQVEKLALIREATSTALTLALAPSQLQAEALRAWALEKSWIVARLSEYDHKLSGWYVRRVGIIVKPMTRSRRREDFESSSAVALGIGQDLLAWATGAKTVAELTAARDQ